MEAPTTSSPTCLQTHVSGSGKKPVACRKSGIWTTSILLFWENPITFERILYCSVRKEKNRKRLLCHAYHCFRFLNHKIKTKAQRRRMKMKNHGVLITALLMLPLAVVSAFVTSSSPSALQKAPSTIPCGPTQHHHHASCMKSSSGLAMTADVAAGGAAAAKDDSGGATVSELIFNLVKNIVGAGVLSLPVGIAAFADAPSAVVPAVALIAIIGALSGYGFALIGRVCAYTNTKSYRDAWSKTVSESTSWIPASIVTFKTFCAILAYSMILGDTFVSLLATGGVSAGKTLVTVVLTATVLLPLCLLKNLSSLAPFSLVGSLGMIYTAVAMTIRYMGKSYLAGGKFATDTAANLRPSFGTVGASGVTSPAVAILVGMLSTAYMVSATLCNDHASEEVVFLSLASA